MFSLRLVQNHFDFLKEKLNNKWYCRKKVKISKTLEEENLIKT